MNQSQQASAQPKGGSSKWLLTVLAVVVVLGGGYLLYAKYGKSTTTVSTSPSPEKTSTTPTTNETAGWKTYANDTYGFSFKYPKDWEVKILEEDKGLYSTTIRFRPVSLKEDYLGSVEISTETTDTAISRIKNSFSNNSTFDGQSNTTFAGNEATKLAFTNKVDSNIKPILYLVPKTDLYIFGGEGSTSTQDNNTIKKIFSTFQFTK